MSKPALSLASHFLSFITAEILQGYGEGSAARDRRRGIAQERDIGLLVVFNYKMAPRPFAFGLRDVENVRDRASGGISPPGGVERGALTPPPPRGRGGVQARPPW